MERIVGGTLHQPYRGFGNVVYYPYHAPSGDIYIVYQACDGVFYSLVSVHQQRNGTFEYPGLPKQRKNISTQTEPEDCVLNDDTVQKRPAVSLDSEDKRLLQAFAQRGKKATGREKKKDKGISSWRNAIDTAAKSNEIKDSFFDHQIPGVVCDEICNEVKPLFTEGTDYSGLHYALPRGYIAGRVKYQGSQEPKEKDDGLSCIKSVANFGHKESLLFLLRNNLIPDLEKQPYAQRIMKHSRTTEQERAEMVEFLDSFKKKSSRRQQSPKKTLGKKKKSRCKKEVESVWVVKKPEEDRSNVDQSPENGAVTREKRKTFAQCVQAQSKNADSQSASSQDGCREVGIAEQSVFYQEALVLQNTLTSFYTEPETERLKNLGEFHSIVWQLLPDFKIDDISVHDETLKKRLLAIAKQNVEKAYRILQSGC